MMWLFFCYVVQAYFIFGLLRYIHEQMDEESSIDFIARVICHMIAALLWPITVIVFIIFWYFKIPSEYIKIFKEIIHSPKGL